MTLLSGPVGELRYQERSRRMLDSFESHNRSRPQVKAGSGNTREKNDTALIGDQCHSINDLGSGHLLQQVGQRGKRIVPAQSTESAGSRMANPRLVILKASRETGHHLRVARIDTLLPAKQRSKQPNQ